jgi:DNA helicase-2/ATP-dependent DNA helicase PcrA
MTHPAPSSDGAVHLDDDTATGPQLIIAGAATRHGQTQLERTVDLIEHCGLAPEALLVVTLTDNAARELTTRIRNRLNARGIKFNPSAMYAGTFLALCLRLLDEHRDCTRMQRNYTVMDPFDQHYFLYQRLSDYRALPNIKLVLGKDGARWNQAQTLLKRLNAVTEQALDAKDLAAATPPEGRALAACHKLYLQQIEKANALDFSTVQLAALRLLEDNPGVLAYLKSQLAYLIIDAQQENSIIKERVLRCLVDTRSAPCLLSDEKRTCFRIPATGNKNAVTESGYAENIVEFPQNGKAPARYSPSEAVPWWLA